MRYKNCIINIDKPGTQACKNIKKKHNIKVSVHTGCKGQLNTVTILYYLQQVNTLKEQNFSCRNN